MSPHEAKTIASFLINDFQHEIPVTARVIAAAPADGMTYAPDAKSKTGLALIRHMVIIDEWLLNSIANGAFVGGTTDESDACGIMTPADAAAKYTELVGAALARVSALSDEKLAEPIDFFGMMQAPPAAMLGFTIKHSIHHRGQLSSYLRSMGGKVPAIYGTSGDM